MLTTEQVSFSGHNDNRTEQLYYAYRLMAACEHPTSHYCFQDINTPLQLQSDHVEQSAIFNGQKGGIKDRSEETRGCY